ncbi:hypothetical protein JQR88_24825 (plasmid) [Pseudomonas luteola]|uniref:hypothetical protein n=1 Tax=Pseudomonas luteola TaxID=47886 RepID=UPI003DA13F30
MSNADQVAYMPEADDRDVKGAISSAAFSATYQLSAQFPEIDQNFEYHLCVVLTEMLRGRSLVQGCMWGAELKRLVAD